MGLFSKKPRVDPQEMTFLRSEVAEVRIRLDASEREKATLEVQVQQLDAVTAALAMKTATIDDVAMRMTEVDLLKRQVAQIDVMSAKVMAVAGLNGKLTDLAKQVASTSADAKQAKEQSAALQVRISNVTAELANQLGELSHEIDDLAANQANQACQASAVQPIVAEQPVSAEILDQLHSAQVRLANEQARYEIAFRQDLAMLAEQVKRPRTNR